MGCRISFDCYISDTNPLLSEGNVKQSWMVVYGNMTAALVHRLTVMVIEQLEQKLEKMLLAELSESGVSPYELRESPLWQFAECQIAGWISAHVSAVFEARFEPLKNRLGDEIRFYQELDPRHRPRGNFCLAYVPVDFPTTVLEISFDIPPMAVTSGEFPVTLDSALKVNEDYFMPQYLPIKIQMDDPSFANCGEDGDDEEWFS